MPHEKDKVFGEWFLDTHPPEAIHVDHVLGGRVSHDSRGRPEWVELHWQSAGDQLYHRVQLDFPNAMFLLSLLKSIQLETGTPFPDDPRAKA